MIADAGGTEGGPQDCVLHSLTSSWLNLPGSLELLNVCSIPRCQAPPS